MKLLWAALLVCAVWGAQLNADEAGGDLVYDLDSSESVTDLGESEVSTNEEGMLTFLGQPEMTLGEIQAVADGSRMLDTSGVKRYRDKFVKLAEKIKSDSLKQSALMLAQTSAS